MVRTVLPPPEEFESDIAKIISSGMLTKGPYLRELEETVLHGLPADESFVDQLKRVRDKLTDLIAQELAAA